MMQKRGKTLKKKKKKDTVTVKNNRIWPESGSAEQGTETACLTLEISQHIL